MTKEVIEAAVRPSPREAHLKDKWKGVADGIPVNETQYAFDTEARLKNYVDSQFPPSDPDLRARYDWYREEWYRRAKEFDPGPAPLAVICELVSTCDLGCNMCYTIVEEFQQKIVGETRMLPWPVVKAVIDECASLGVPSMLFSWRGESTLYRGRDEEGRTITFPDVLKYAREKGILEVTCLTHGQSISPDMAEKIVEAQPNWISFSVDGLGATYNKIRVPRKQVGTDYDAFAVVTGNIKRIVEIRNRQGLRKPQIRCNTIYLAISDNSQAYHDYMSGIGVDWITANELLDFRGPSLPEDRIRKNWACQYPFQRLTVSANGVIVPCTGAHREEQALILGQYIGSPQKRVLAGDNEVKVQEMPQVTLAEAWRGKKLEGIRRLHKEGRRELIDPGCKHCRHGAIKGGLDFIPEDWDVERMEWTSGSFSVGRRVWKAEDYK